MIDEQLAKLGFPKRYSAEDELRMWKEWKATGFTDGRKLQPLLKSLQNVVQDHINRHWSSGMRIPKEVVRAELERHLVQALKTYDPTRGAQIKTWVQWNMRKVSRFIGQHQNVARITSKRVEKIGDFDRAKVHLSQKLGRPPTSFEVADHMDWTVPDVDRMEREKVKDIPFSASQADELVDLLKSKNRQQRYLLKYDLTPDELFVYEHLTGFAGKPKTTATKIARMKGWSDAKVHRIKKAITKKAEELFR